MAEGNAPAHRSRGGNVLVAALVVDSVGNGLFLPLSLVYFVELTGIELGLLGVLLSIATAITLPVPLLAGQLADKVGALPVVVGAQLLQAAGFLAYAWVQGPASILAAATLVAIGVRFFWSAIFAAVADYADGSIAGRTHDSWYALTTVARTPGLAAGGLVTGVVVADGRTVVYRFVAYAAAGCFTAAAALIAALVRAPVASHSDNLAPSGYRILFRDRPFLSLIGLNTVWALSSMMLATALPTVVLRGINGPPWLTAAVLVANAVLITALSSWVIRRLAGHRRTRSIAFAAGLWAIWSLGMATLTPDHLAWTVPILIVSTLIFTAAEIIHAPVSSALASSTAPPASRGRYLAAFQYSFAFASIVAPAFFTTLFTVNRSTPWLALAVLNVASIVGLLALEHHLPTGSDLRRHSMP